MPSPIDLIPDAPADSPTLAKGERWLRDCADGIWTAPKYADLYAPMLMREYHQRGDQLAIAEVEIAALKTELARTRTLQAHHTDIIGRAAILVARHTTAPWHTRARLPHRYRTLINHLTDAVRGTR